MIDVEKKVFDLSEVSDWTGLTVWRLREMIDRGQLQAVQPGGRRGKLFIQARELERILEPVGKK